MTDPNDQVDPSLSKDVFEVAPARRRGGRLPRLIRKELREILRDRRTIFTLILMPLLVYPMLNLVFQRYLISSVSVAGSTTSKIVVGFESRQDAMDVLLLVQRGWEARQRDGRRRANAVAKTTGAAITASPPSPTTKPENSNDNPDNSDMPASDSVGRKLASSPDPVHTPKPFPEVEWKVSSDLNAAVQLLDVDLAIRVVGLGDSVSFELLHRPDSNTSRDALEMVEASLYALNLDVYRGLLRRQGLPAPDLVETQRVAIESQGGGVNMLGSLVPLILIMMTVTGAVYPSIDLTAGERERSTLETLFAAPVSRFGLLLAKYTAVVTVALLTAVVNLTAMTVTLYAGGLGKMVFGDEGLTVFAVIAVFCLLILFAAFFSAVLLMITSSARSFKEAQAYLIPLMLVSLGPGLISLLPGVELTYWLAVTPLINVVLMARDLFQREPLGWPALLALVSTFGYTLFAIGAAASVFGRDAVMQAQSTRTRRAEGPWTAASPSMATMCLLVLIPFYYLLGGWLSHLETLALSVRLALAAAVTGLLFGVVPWLVCVWERVPLRHGMRLRWPAAATFVPAVIFGLSAWPFAHQLVLFGQQMGIYTLELSQLERVREMLETWRASLSPQILLICLAAAPALFEELFFRGFLFRAWRKPLGPAGVIITTSLVFGAFHVISGHQLTPERFMPSTFLGLVLGFVAYRTGSIWPGVLLHFCNNGLLLMMAYYKDSLAERGFGVQEQSSLPIAWLGAAFGACLLAISLLMWIPRPQEPLPSTKEPS